VEGTHTRKRREPASWPSRERPDPKLEEKRPCGWRSHADGRGRRCQSGPVSSPEQKNFAEIARLEELLGELRANRATARETEAIREIGLEIAIAIREVGAMLVNVGWEQTFVTDPPKASP
jgi:hypothetical protein